MAARFESLKSPAVLLQQAEAPAPQDLTLPTITITPPPRDIAPMAFPTILDSPPPFFSQTQPRPQASLQTLPPELRQQILSHLLPSDPVISYKCPLGTRDPLPFPSPKKAGLESKHTHPSCGSGPGYVCLRDHKQRKLDVMRTCRLLYEDCVQLLYGRVFEMEVGVSTATGKERECHIWGLDLSVGVNTIGGESTAVHEEGMKAFGRVPWDRMRCVRVMVHGDGGCDAEGIERTRRALQRVSEILTHAERRLKRVEVWLLTLVEEGEEWVELGSLRMCVSLVLWAMLACTECLMGMVGTSGLGVKVIGVGGSGDGEGMKANYLRDGSGDLKGRQSDSNAGDSYGEPASRSWSMDFGCRPFKVQDVVEGLLRLLEQEREQYEEAERG